MASRYYPATKLPGVRVRGACQGTWARQSVFGRSWSPDQRMWRLSSLKTDAGARAIRNIRTNQQGDYDFFYARWSTPPLEAQTVGGTIDLCQLVKAVWEDGVNPDSNDSVVRYKLHVYITQGESTTVRHVLLDNYLDPVNFPGTSGAVWRSLTSAQALTSGDVVAGDTIVIELGFRVVSSPTPAVSYPPSNQTFIPAGYTGVTSAHIDAVAGDTSTLRTAWFEFSQTLTEQAAAAAPANDACADAEVIPPALPFTSAEINTTGSTDTARRVWWTWTAPSSGKVCFHTFGTNYAAALDAFTGSCAGLVAVTPSVTDVSFPTNSSRSLSVRMWDAVAGTQYWIRVSSSVAPESAADSGGLCRIGGFYRDTTPQEDDLYLPNGVLVQLREDAIVNLSGLWTEDAPTGVAIDYTGRTIDDLNGGTHSNERLLMGLHDFDLIEILDLPTLSYGTVGQIEVETISDPWNEAVTQHPAQIYVTAAGMLYVGWFGNGYLFVSGQGTLPAILNAPSNGASYSSVKQIDAINGDIQAGAPYADTLYQPAAEVTSPWAITLDEANGILYYTSGGFYEPVGGQIIKRFDLNGNSQLADFATIALQPGNNPGLKGLQFLPNGELLVCNSTVVHRLDSDGDISQTFTPSIPEDSQSLADVKLTADGLKLWAIDEVTGRLFRFVLATGLEDLTVQPYLQPNTLVQMAIYQPNGVQPPEPPGPPLPAGCPVTNLEPRAVTPLHGCPPSTPGV